MNINLINKAGALRLTKRSETLRLAGEYATGKLQYGCIPTECPQQGGIQLLPSYIIYGNGAVLIGCSVRD